MSGLNSNHIGELLHSLQTLDVELYEAARKRLLTESEYAVRNDRLRHAFYTLGQFKEMVAQRENSNEFKSQVDLPIMGGYNRSEQKIVMHFVGDTMRQTEKLSKVATNVSKWTFAAASGSVGSLQSLWRLSWLRGSILRINQDLANVRKARQVVESFIERMSMGGGPSASKINQQDLLAAFCEFDATISRVTAMKSGLCRETTRNRDMRRWLSLYSKVRRQKNPEASPPEPSDVEKAAIFIDDPLTGGSKLAQQRLVVARQVETALSDWESAKRIDSKAAKHNAKNEIKAKQLHKQPIQAVENTQCNIDLGDETSKIIGERSIGNLQAKNRSKAHRKSKSRERSRS